MTINASALIFAAPPTTQLPDLDLIPTVRLDITRATQIRNVLTELPRFSDPYLNPFTYLYICVRAYNANKLINYRLPAVEIGVAKNVIGKSGAPSVAYFSSRGPSSLSPEILKVRRVE